MNHKYSNIDVVFISHTAEAHEVNEKQFFTQVPNGGTLVSTGLKKVEEIVEKRYHPNNWNIYTFYCGDGDNWAIDNKTALEAFRRLKEINQVMGYTKKLWDWSKLAEDKTFKRIRIEESKDIWAAFKKLFGGKT